MVDDPYRCNRSRTDSHLIHQTNRQTDRQNVSLTVNFSDHLLHILHFFSRSVRCNRSPWNSSVSLLPSLDRQTDRQRVGQSCGRSVFSQQASSLFSQSFTFSIQQQSVCFSSYSAIQLTNLTSWSVSHVTGHNITIFSKPVTFSLIPDCFFHLLR